MADYAVRTFQLNHYVKKYLPEIYYHFKKYKIPSDMIYSKWVLTIFSQYLSLEQQTFTWTLFILVYNFFINR